MTLGTPYLPKSFDFPRELFPALAAAIGEVIIAWGGLECSLNIAVITIFQHAGGKPHAERGQIPVSFKRKIKFLRLCYRKIAAMEPFRDDALSLLERVAEAAGKRNSLVHAHISDYDPQTGQFTFTGLDILEEIAVIGRQPKFTMKDILDIGGYCGYLGGELIQLSGKLVTAFVRNQP